MSNILASIQSKLSEFIMKVDVAKSLPTISAPKLEKPKAPESSSDPLTEGRKKVESKISEEAKKANETAEKAVNDAVEKAKEQQKKLVEDACKNNPIRYDELQMSIAEMGVSLGELATTCAALPVRLALAPASIIGSCPLGPTVQPTQLVMTLKQMKEMGDDLGVKYNNVEASFNKLGLDTVAETAQSCELFQSVPGASGLISVVGTATSLISGILSVAKVGISAVGGSISSVGGGGGRARTVSMFSFSDDEDEQSPGVRATSFKLESPEESGSEVEMESPEISYDASPSTCFAFKPKTYYDEYGHYHKVVENCRIFTVLNKDKGNIPDCNNCTKYKAYSPEITQKVVNNEEEIFGSEGSKENPKPGSLLSRMSGVEGRCTNLEGRATALEGRATVLEGRCTSLENRATKLENRATVLEGRCDVLEKRATKLEERCTILEDRATKLEGRCTVLEEKVDDKVAWSVESGLNEDGGYIYVDLKNSKGETISPKENGHSSYFDYSSITSDTYMESVSRIDIYTYKNLGEDKKNEVQWIVNNWIGPQYRPGWIIPNDNSAWGLDHVTSAVVYKTEEIPYENRTHGTSCMVFTLKNTLGEKISPIWVNATLFGTYYNFKTSIEGEETSKYFSLGFESIDEGFAKSVIATYKYTPQLVE